MAEQQQKALDQMEKASEQLFEGILREEKESKRRADEQKKQLEKKYQQLDEQYKESAKIRSDQIVGFNKEVDDENQRRKEAQERDAAEQQRLGEGHKERMTEKREEFNAKVKIAENADIRGAEQAKAHRNEIVELADKERKDLNVQHEREVNVQTKILESQREQISLEYQRRVDDNKEQKGWNRKERNEARAQLIALKHQNQMERRANLLDQTKSRLNLIKIAGAMAAQESHQFIYDDAIKNCSKRATECINSCLNIEMKLARLVTILHEANKSKSSIENVNVRNIDIAVKIVVSACETAAKSVDSLRSSCSSANDTIRSNGSGISVQKREEYLKFVNKLSAIASESKLLVADAKLHAELKTSVDKIEELKKSLNEMGKKLKEAKDATPMFDNENKVEQAINNQGNHIENSTQQGCNRNEKGDSQSDSQPQPIEGTENTQEEHKHDQE